ncbi:MAG: VOC family protein [Deltaproteobacteria bacterium]|jgi:catechol 2,3-dioxygenase-like lactoylglutathione lyase family enzyme|nr:VOC family protein [Deltaproteobacteria bacterium]
MDIDHVVLWVDDPSRALAFYVDVVGLVAVRGEEFARGEAPFPSGRVGERTLVDLMARGSAEVVRAFTGEQGEPAAGGRLNHVCLAMTRAELEGLRARLAARGVAVTEVPVPSFGARGLSTASFYFQDPDGNVVEVRAYDG